MQNEFCYLFAFTEALIYIPYIVIFLLCIPITRSLLFYDVVDNCRPNSIVNLSHSYTMGQIIKSVCVCQCVCLSVCEHSHGRIS